MLVSQMHLLDAHAWRHCTEGGRTATQLTHPPHTASPDVIVHDTKKGPGIHTFHTMADEAQTADEGPLADAARALEPAVLHNGVCMTPPGEALWLSADVLNQDSERSPFPMSPDESRRELITTAAAHRAAGPAQQQAWRLSW
jgi:hypothetical protein